MERDFGHNFSDVRIHDDGHAHESSARLGALAYTCGRHIVFGEGHFVPHTRIGRALLAHELTHVLQQRSDAQQAAAPVVQRATTAEMHEIFDELSDGAFRAATSIALRTIDATPADEQAELLAVIASECRERNLGSWIQMEIRALSAIERAALLHRIKLASDARREGSGDDIDWLVKEVAGQGAADRLTDSAGDVGAVSAANAAAVLHPEFVDRQIQALKVNPDEFSADVQAGGKVGRVFATVSRAWDVKEVLEFIASGGQENVGDMVALAAEGVAAASASKWALRKFGQGAAKRALLVANTGSIVVMNAWTLYEMFMAGATIRSASEATDEREERSNERIRIAMWEQFWSPYFLTVVPELLEARFDELAAGPPVNHGILPAISASALAVVKHKVRAANDRWLTVLPLIPDWIEKRSMTVVVDGVPTKWYQNLLDGLVDDVLDVENFLLQPGSWELFPDEWDVFYGPIHGPSQ